MMFSSVSSIIAKRSSAFISSADRTTPRTQQLAQAKICRLPGISIELWAIVQVPRAGGE